MKIMYQKKSYALGSSDHHHHQIEHQLNTSGGHLYHPSHCIDHNHHNQQRHNHIHCHHYYLQHQHHHLPQILYQLDSPSGHLHHPSHLPNCPQPQDLQRNQVPLKRGILFNSSKFILDLNWVKFQRAFFNLLIYSHLPHCPQPQDLQRNQVMPQREGLTYWVLNMTCRKYVKKKGK